MKIIKNNLKDMFAMSNNQTNLLLLSSLTSLFQGIVYYIIDKEKFSPKFFMFTVITCFIYYLFYYKTYVNADKSKKHSNSNTSSSSNITLTI